jgi:alpha-ketoglutarate-dependent taurine dioxygenase
MRNVSDEICSENRNTRSVFKKLFLQEWCRLRDNVEKYYTYGQATDDNMANAHFTPHTDAKFHENPSSGSRVIPLG